MKTWEILIKINLYLKYQEEMIEKNHTIKLKFFNLQDKNKKNPFLKRITIFLQIRPQAGKYFMKIQKEAILIKQKEEQILIIA